MPGTKKGWSAGTSSTVVRSLLHRLEQQQVAGDMLADQVEREQRVAQVVEHAHEDHEVEPLAERADVIDRELGELDVVEAERLGREPRLREIAVVAVDAEHPRRAAPLHLDRVEARVAADVEHGLAGEVRRHGIGEATELGARIVAEEMVGRGLDAAQIDIVEPGSQRLDPFPQRILADAIRVVVSDFVQQDPPFAFGGHDRFANERKPPPFLQLPCSINKAAKGSGSVCAAWRATCREWNLGASSRHCIIDE